MDTVEFWRERARDVEDMARRLAERSRALADVADKVCEASSRYGLSCATGLDIRSGKMRSCLTEWDAWLGKQESDKDDALLSQHMTEVTKDLRSVPITSTRTVGSGEREARLHEEVALLRARVAELEKVRFRQQRVDKPSVTPGISKRLKSPRQEIKILLKGETMTTNEELADTLVQRLNQLIADPDVQDDIGNLSKIQVLASGATANHPTIQVTPEGTLALVGLLNGICGTVQDGPNKGRGLITAVFTEQGSLMSFTRTKEGK